VNATSPSPPSLEFRAFDRVGAGRPIRLVWTLEEAGAEFELVTMTAEEAASPSHRARHPMGRVPALVDSAGPVFESTALCLHVADSFPEAGLIPAVGTAERARVYQWSVFAMTEVEAPAVDYYRSKAESPSLAAAAAQRSQAALEAVSSALEGTGDCIAGSGFTVADIVVSEVLRIAARVGAVDLPLHVQDYVDGLGARPARLRAEKRIAEGRAARAIPRG
jgi:glutathione S-transferase